MHQTRLVVAIDVPTFVRAKNLIETLDGIDVTFKVGYEALYGYGPELLALLESRGAAYMLDVKLHDIPRTVHAAVRELVRPGVALLTVHALGGAEMLAAAASVAAASISAPPSACTVKSATPGRTNARTAA